MNKILREFKSKPPPAPLHDADRVLPENIPIVCAKGVELLLPTVVGSPGICPWLALA